MQIYFLKTFSLLAGNLKGSRKQSVRKVFSRFFLGYLFKTWKLKPLRSREIDDFGGREMRLKNDAAKIILLACNGSAAAGFR